MIGKNSKQFLRTAKKSEKDLVVEPGLKSQFFKNLSKNTTDYQ